VWRTHTHTHTDKSSAHTANSLFGVVYSSTVRVLIMTSHEYATKERVNIVDSDCYRLLLRAARMRLLQLQQLRTSAINYVGTIDASARRANALSVQKASRISGKHDSDVVLVALWSLGIRLRGSYRLSDFVRCAFILCLFQRPRVGSEDYIHVCMLIQCMEARCRLIASSDCCSPWPAIQLFLCKSVHVWNLVSSL